MLFEEGHVFRRGQELVLAVNGESSMWEETQSTDKDLRGHIIEFKVCLTMQSQARKVPNKASAR